MRAACEETAWFADHAYTNSVPMEVTAFKALFHYQHIVAGRNLADESSDKTRILSRDMIDVAEQEEQWKDLIRTLPDKIIQPIQNLHIQERVAEASVESLKEAIEEISKTNGGQAETLQSIWMFRRMLSIPYCAVSHMQNSRQVITI